MHDVLGHRRMVRHEHRRLVHVAPHARHSRVHQPRMQGTPPLPRRGVREIRERTQPRPHDVPVLGAVPRQAEEPAVSPLAIHRVRLVDFHARIRDHHHAEPLRAQFGNQPGRVREAFAVPREHPVAVHVVDVEVEHVARDPASPELGCQGPDLVSIHVGPSRLLIPQRPQRRHRHPARQSRVALEHVGRRRARQHVDREVVARRHRHARRIRLGQVQLDPPRVVVEHPVRPSLVQAQHEGDRRVEVVERRGVPLRRIHVPEDLPRPGLLEPRRPLTAAEVPLTRRAQLDQAIELRIADGLATTGLHTHDPVHDRGHTRLSTP